MNIYELSSLSKWVDSNIVRLSILQSYKDLCSILEFNSQSSRNVKPFHDEKTFLIEKITQINLLELTSDQLSLLEAWGILDAIGERGRENILHTLEKNSLDVVTAHMHLNDIAKKLENGIQSASSVALGLNGYIDNLPKSVEEPNDQMIVRVRFFGKSSISNIAEFKQQGADWYLIARGLALYSDGAPEDIQVVGADRGSVIISLMIKSGVIVTAFTHITLRILKIIKSVQEIRLIQQKIKHLKLKNPELESAAKNTSDTEEKNGLDILINEESKKFQDKPEYSKNVGVAIRKISDFLREGGEIEFIPPPQYTEDSTPELKDINNKIEEIRSIEQNLRIEGPPD